jgi:hypothetical protein
MFTAEPEATLVPAIGLSEITMPAATIELLCVVTLPITTPAPVIALIAAAWLRPTTFGTTIVGAPVGVTVTDAAPEISIPGMPCEKLLFGRPSKLIPVMLTVAPLGPVIVKSRVVDSDFET